MELQSSCFFSLSKRKRKRKEKSLAVIYLSCDGWWCSFFGLGFLTSSGLAPPTLGVGEEEDERRLFTRLSICRRPGPPFLFSDFFVFVVLLFFFARSVVSSAFFLCLRTNWKTVWNSFGSPEIPAKKEKSTTKKEMLEIDCQLMSDLPLVT